MDSQEKVSCNLILIWLKVTICYTKVDETTKQTKTWDHVSFSFLLYFLPQPR